ncbi:MAG: hypothetical protein KDD10_30775, partial [Phaeodactylibacter sp.]|nr:hypothetical protein [Phaeodactylibacter sp.]
DDEGKLLSTFEGHTDAINGAHLVSCGELLLTLSADGTARTWERSGKPISEMRCCPPGIFYGEVLPDGEHFMAWSTQEGAINIWNINGRRAARLPASSLPLSHAGLLKDGQRIFSWSQEEAAARLWDIEGTLLYEATGLQSAKTTEDGGHFWLRTSGGAVELRDAGGRAVRCPAEPLHQGDGSWVSPGAQRLLTWRSGEGPKAWQAAPHLFMLQTGGRLHRANFLPGGRRVLTLPYKGTPKIWSPDGKLLLELNAPEHYCEGIWLLPQQQRYLAWYRSGIAHLFDEAGNQLRTIGEKRTGRKRMFSSQPEQLWARQAHFFSDEQRLLLWYLDGQARLWNLDGQLLASLDGLKSDLKGAHVFAGEQLTVAWGINGTSDIWNLEGEPVGRLREKVLDVQVIGGGSRLLALCYDGIPRICDARGKAIKRLKGHSARVVAARVFPDGQRFLTWAADGSARIWDSEGKALARLEGHPSPIKGAAILPGGHRLFTWAEDGRLRVWADDGALVATLGYPQGQIDGYQVFGEGRRLMGWNQEGVIRIWDEEGRLLEELNAPGGGILCAHISPDGRRLLTFFGEEELKVWPLPSAIYEWLQGDPVDRLTEREVRGYEDDT